MNQAPSSMFEPPDRFGQTAQPPPRSKTLSRLGWALVILAVLGVGSCASLVGVVMYIGATAPETKVYASNEIPERYVATVGELKLVDPGETLVWFYSDSLGDIRDGFSFVSNRKVVVYDGSRTTSPATVVAFHEIADADLHRETSWVFDSTITLTLRDGRAVAFPVSNELDRDERVLETIRASMPAEGAGEEP